MDWELILAGMTTLLLLVYLSVTLFYPERF